MELLPRSNPEYSGLWRGVRTADNLALAVQSFPDIALFPGPELRSESPQAIVPEGADLKLLGVTYGKWSKVRWDRPPDSGGTLEGWVLRDNITIMDSPRKQLVFDSSVQGPK